MNECWRKSCNVWVSWIHWRLGRSLNNHSSRCSVTRFYLHTDISDHESHVVCWWMLMVASCCWCCLWFKQSHCRFGSWNQLWSCICSFPMWSNCMPFFLSSFTLNLAMILKTKDLNMHLWRLQQMRSKLLMRFSCMMLSWNVFAWRHCSRGNLESMLSQCAMLNSVGLRFSVLRHAYT